MFDLLKSVRVKTVSYAMMLFLIVAGAIVGIASISSLHQIDSVKIAWDSYVNGAVKKTGLLSDLRHALGYGGFIHEFKNAILRRDKVLLDRAREHGREAMEAIADYRQIGVNAQEEAALGRLEEMIAEYTARIPVVQKLIDSGATAEAIDKQVRVSDKNAIDGIAALLAHVRDQREASGTVVHEAVGATQLDVYITLTVVIALVASLLVVFTWFARSRIIRPIYALIEAVDRIGQGDLRQQITGLGSDEIGALGGQLNAMVVNIRDITLQTRDAVANLNSAASETLASTKQQAASVQQQFAAIQQTTATLDEINQSGQQMTKRAQEVVGQAETAAERSQDGLRSMDDVSRLMDAIEEQTEFVAEHIVGLSEKTQAIGDIISTVNDIAERSQLLALNAAIEAATAGEEGRSFAVVAEEMKMLADQAKDATTQVSSILGEIQKGINASVMSTEESVKRVTGGRAQTENTLKSITELAGTIESNVRAFEQIVASTNQQRIGLEQVSEALKQIRGGSEQTAAGTKQIEQAVANVNALGDQLNHAMERYAV